MDQEMEFQLDLVRRNADSGRNFVKWRDVAICRAHACGAGYAQIAEVARMSRQGIQKIVERVDNSVTEGVSSES